MKVYYDYQIFMHQKFGGVSKYFINLVENLNDFELNKKIIAPFHKNYYLAGKDTNVKKFIYFDLKTKNINFLSHKINKLYTKYLYNIKTPNIFHFTYFNEKYYLKKKTKHIITIYDLIKEKFYNSQHQKGINIKKEYFKNVDRIICISKNTKKDLIDLYGIDEKIIDVIHLGVSFKKNFISIDHLLPRKPFILFVGARSRYKNFENFVLSYSNSDKLKKDFDVVCFGGMSFTGKEQKLLQDLKVYEKFYQVEGNDEELNYAYKKARCFVFPSLYEGFGLPLLESMNMSCPVICSNTSSFPEVVNKSAAMFDPNNIDQMKFEIENLVYNNEKISNLIALGQQNIKNFTWAKCADETLKVYKKLT